MMNDFYEKVQKVSEANDDLSETAKAVVFIRAAIEGSAREVGIESTVYLVSKLMTATLGIMAGDERDRRICLPVGQRNTGVRQSADSSGNTGHHPEGNSGGHQRQRFLAAAAENEGIPALQPHHPFSSAREGD